MPAAASDAPLIRDRFVQTRAGRLHLLEAGAGEPLLLLASNGCSAHQYRAVLPLLAAHGHAMALDILGQGDSDPLTRHHSIEMHGAAVLALLDALELPRASIVGTSVGGLIALQLARDTPRRLGPLVLVDTPLRTEAFWAAQWPRLERAFATPTQTFEEVRPRFRELTPELHERWNIDRRKAGAWTLMDVMWAGREFDALGAAAAARVPTLVLIGGRGPIADLVDVYRARMPHAAVEVMPDCGHFPMVDDPPDFSRRVLRFLQGGRA